MQSSVIASAEKLWDFLNIKQDLVKSDAIIALGNHDINVALHAVKLFNDGWAPLLIFSGGLGKITKETFGNISEAEKFFEVAIKQGVPSENIIIENKSCNTRENILFTKDLLKSRGIILRKIVVVTLPHETRRAYATIRKLWPEMDAVMSSENVSLKDFLKRYPKEGLTQDHIISLIVAALNRIIVLPSKGLQIEQEVPDDVLKAYQGLVEMGYSQYLWK